MTPAAFRRLALSLAGAHEEPHFERVSFRVGKKIFATMTPDGREAMVRVEAEGVQALLLARPDVFFSYGTWTIKNGSLGVWLAKADAETLRALVIDSYQHVAAKKSRPETSRRAKTPAARARGRSGSGGRRNDG